MRDFVQGGGKSGLETYSAVCLRHTWNYRDFAVWITEMLHDARPRRLSAAQIAATPPSTASSIPFT
ncbi:hypothetical protein [Amycolatopsis sp. lyj-346]|uniref:hypothetical protein n=1 Tax=Amycolatopsis sp. lyj-346 TaxID=2789289 RepID=UPI00397A8A9F